MFTGVSISIRLSFVIRGLSQFEEEEVSRKRRSPPPAAVFRSNRRKIDDG